MPNYRIIRSLQKEKQKQAAARAESRESHRQDSLRRLTRGGVALASLAAVVVAGWAGLGPVRLSGLTDFTQTVGRRGAGFPLESGGGNVLQAALAGDALALLWPTSLDIHTPTAHRSNRADAYTDPAISAAGGRVVQFDRASGKLALHSRTRELYMKELPRPLFCVGLGRRGDLAAACGAEGASTEITAWDTKGNQVFNWRCEKEYPGALQPSGDGRGLGLCLMGTEQAAVYARFVEFAYSKQQPVTDLRIQDAWLYGAVQRSGCWLAVGDQAVYRVTRGAQVPEAFSYEGRALQAFGLDEGGLCAVLLEDWDNRALLRIYNRRGTLELERSFARRPLELICRGGSVYLRFDGTLLRWQKATGFRQSGGVPPGTQQIFPAGSAAYVITLGGIDRVRLRWRAMDKDMF